MKQLFILAIAFLVFACAGSKKATDNSSQEMKPSAIDGDWTFAYYEEIKSGDKTEPGEGVEPVLHIETLEDGTLRFAGQVFNNYMGVFTREGKKGLSLNGAMAVTRKMPMNPGEEEKYIKFIEKVSSYRMTSDGMLELIHQDGDHKMVFEK
ncbi:META domain-containing protein [Algivirga pacifica]|uniref:DUF306 domain-containing protein n=1 Tax=Algivirga pacifica TaxID=1162670 RepID=A0ABP9DAS0_9BACT